MTKEKRNELFISTYNELADYVQSEYYFITDCVNPYVTEKKENESFPEYLKRVWMESFCFYEENDRDEVEVIFNSAIDSVIKVFGLDKMNPTEIQ